MADPVLSIRNLSVTFSTPSGPIDAVRDVSIDIAASQTVAVVGASGSGKSTTAAAVNRLLPPNARITSGSVWFNGTDLATVPARQMQRIRGAQIGLVPQDPMSNLNPMMRVGNQVAEALEVHGIAAGTAAHARVVELLDLVGIPDAAQRANQYPHEFSGGMRQRVLIAIGLACRPQLLIADEPTSALDVTVQRRILDQLAELTEKMGTALFLITHDLGLAAERADHVVVMNEGAVVEAGEAAAILGDPQHEYTRRLLAAAPSLSSASMLPDPSPGEAPDGRSPDDEAPLVTVDGLVKTFPIRGRGLDAPTDFTAVDDVAITIPRGSTVSIVGESGSGKSTMANLVLALDHATAGSITFDGADVTAMDRRGLFALRRRVQPVFQNPFASLDPRYTVERCIAEPLRVHKIGTKTGRRAAVADLLEQVALPAGLAGRFPHELSGGQRQRVAIARALALEPELIVLDEAVSALDVLVQAQILALLTELQQERRLSYLFISHDLAVVRMISHHVYVMQRGRIVEHGTPAAIFDDPQHDYTRELLAAIPTPAHR
ncbi:dipeptide ABC transporter ATP-binding protein [Desertimonas flava]|uniref:dipeptide ABC transporter ATP-binding protein n=1 Tax=Desertimonas flava TaxID=2064846 RepID=UPI000E34C273|nr:ABC transporter ATP-binding protein [Desertimonas flava]